MNASFEELSKQVVNWAEEKGIVQMSFEQIQAQLNKTREEVDEFEEAARRVYSLGEKGFNDFHAMFLELGDILVTVIVVAECAGIDPTKALEQAYNKIKNRTGKVVNGQFKKD